MAADHSTLRPESREVARSGPVSTSPRATTSSTIPAASASMQQQLHRRRGPVFASSSTFGGTCSTPAAADCRRPGPRRPRHRPRPAAVSRMQYIHRPLPADHRRASKIHCDAQCSHDLLEPCRKASPILALSRSGTHVSLITARPPAVSVCRRAWSTSELEQQSTSEAQRIRFRESGSGDARQTRSENTQRSVLALQRSSQWLRRPIVLSQRYDFLRIVPDHRKQPMINGIASDVRGADAYTNGWPRRRILSESTLRTRCALASPSTASGTTSAIDRSSSRSGRSEMPSTHHLQSPTIVSKFTRLPASTSRTSRTATSGIRFSHALRPGISQYVNTNELTRAELDLRAVQKSPPTVSAARGIFTQAVLRRGGARRHRAFTKTAHRRAAAVVRSYLRSTHPFDAIWSKTPFGSLRPPHLMPGAYDFSASMPGARVRTIPEQQLQTCAWWQLLKVPAQGSAKGRSRRQSRRATSTHPAFRQGKATNAVSKPDL